MPRRAPQNLGAELARGLLVGLGRIGGRAAASAAKSVLKDGRRIARQVEDRLSATQTRIDDMIGDRAQGDADE